jgi:hypothetical protein
VLATYNLCAPPCYSEARRIRSAPIVIVPTISEVTKTGRVFLLAPRHGTLAIAYFDCVGAATHRLLCAEMRNHSFVMLGAERSEEVTLLTDHDAGILPCRREDCKQMANLVVAGMVLAFGSCKSSINAETGCAVKRRWSTAGVKPPLRDWILFEDTAEAVQTIVAISNGKTVWSWSIGVVRLRCPKSSAGLGFSLVGPLGLQNVVTIDSGKAA